MLKQKTVAYDKKPTIQWMSARKGGVRSTMYIYGIFWLHTFTKQREDLAFKAAWNYKTSNTLS